MVKVTKPFYSVQFHHFSMSLNNFCSPMMFTNDLENQIKFLICFESKADKFGGGH